MKILGRKEDGTGVMLEANEAELRELSRLAMAVEGKTFPETFNPHEFYLRTDFDFTNTFSVIRAYYEARFRITELESLFASIKESMNRV